MTSVKEDRVVDYNVMEYVFVSGQSCETFCKDCGQLRLWAKPEQPKACAGCGSGKIVVGPLLGAELPKLREAWIIERMKYYPCSQLLDTGGEIEEQEAPTRCGEPERYRAKDNRARQAHLCLEHWRALPEDERGLYSELDSDASARAFMLRFDVPTVVIFSDAERVLTGGERK